MRYEDYYFSFYGWLLCSYVFTDFAILRFVRNLQVSLTSKSLILGSTLYLILF